MTQNGRLCKMESWSREEIATCSCSERKYRHVHCPCLQCRGSATDRNTELQQWRESQLLTTEVESESSSFHEISGEIHVSTASCASPEPAEVEANLSDGSDESEVVTSVGSESDIEDPAGLQGMEPQNPLKKVILAAVINALKVMDESGSSLKTFEEILNYGKTMLLTLIDESVDVLSAMWPKNWNDIQLLLREEGFEDAKEYFIYFCRTEKVITRNGKTHVKFTYSGNYSTMDKKDSLCTHCGNKGYLKYY